SGAGKRRRRTHPRLARDQAQGNARGFSERARHPKQGRRGGRFAEGNGRREVEVRRRNPARQASAGSRGRLSERLQRHERSALGQSEGAARRRHAAATRRARLTVTDLRAFLDSAGWGDAACEPLTGDASARKYFRLRKPDRTAVLMDASRVLDSVAPFIRIGEHLRSLGFSAPEIFSRDEAAGLLLLEDFGDASFAQLLEKSCSRRGNEAEIGNRKSEIGNKSEPPHVGSYGPEQLFTLAVDVLVALHRHPRTVSEN